MDIINTHIIIIFHALLALKYDDPGKNQHIFNFLLFKLALDLEFELLGDPLVFQVVEREVRVEFQHHGYGVVVEVVVQKAVVREKFGVALASIGD